jgi:hypothetical protein
LASVAFPGFELDSVDEDEGVGDVDDEEDELP